MPTVHSSVVGGSSAPRVIACPGSVVLCQNAPEMSASHAAQVGSALHDVMENYLCSAEELNAPPRHPREWIGKRHNGIEITQRMFDLKLEPCLDFFNYKIDPDEWLVESQVSWGDAIPGAFGTADILFKKGDRVGLIDWKFGDGVPVSAEGNAQIKFYLGAALKSMPEFFEGFDEFEGHIFQPFEDEDKPKHSRVFLTRKDLDEFEAELVAALKASRANDPKLNMGKHCTFCDARFNCPKITNAASGAMDANPKDMDEDELRNWLTLADNLESWVKDIRKYAADYIRRNGSLEGWKITNKVGHRRFKDQKEAEAWARSKRIKVGDMKVTKFASPAEMERVIKRYGISKDDPEFLDLIEKPITGEKMVPEDAKGEAKASPQALMTGLANQLQAMNLQKG